MLQKISVIAMAAIATISFSWHTEAVSTTSEAYIFSERDETLIYDEPEQPIENYIMVEVPVELEGNLLTYTESDSFAELQQLLEESLQRQESAMKMADAARECGYPEDHPIIILAEQEWTNAYELSLIYQAEINATKLAKAWDEYPIATEVWLYLTNTMGYSDYVAAGIIGNMMAECGGLTLNLDWTATNRYSNCYGLCQWHPKYHQEVQGANLQQQLEYMSYSFPAILDQYAFEYQKGFTYKDFLNLTSASEAAEAFCIIYERPGVYDPYRGELADQAYSYFVK